VGWAPKQISALQGRNFQLPPQTCRPSPSFTGPKEPPKNRGKCKVSFRLVPLFPPPINIPPTPARQTPAHICLRPPHPVQKQANPLWGSLDSMKRESEMKAPYQKPNAFGNLKTQKRVHSLVKKCRCDVGRSGQEVSARGDDLPFFPSNLPRPFLFWGPRTAAAQKTHPAPNPISKSAAVPAWLPQPDLLNYFPAPAHLSRCPTDTIPWGRESPGRGQTAAPSA